jgi:hypothetical protein
MKTIYTVGMIDTVKQEQTTIVPPTVPETQKNTYSSTETNVYPTFRTILLGLSILLAVCLVIFLIYQNGRSIYANGL